MEKVGVELLVQGLSSFMSDMGKADKGIQGLIPTTGLLGSAFSALGGVFKSVGDFVTNVLAHALGELLADAVQWVTAQIKELISQTIEMGSEFQRLSIRLDRLNFNALTADIDRSAMSTEDYAAAMKLAGEMTQEQLKWSIRLGASSAFSSKDVSNVYTLAQTYGYTADEAKTLTEQIIDFSAGMGLTSEQIQRIIINFGQMRQQGKLNGQDLKDLGRGAFLPINRILELTADKLGLTNEEFTKMRMSGKLGATGVDAFVMAFGELVGTDFQGAGQMANKVLEIAIENVKELWTGIGAGALVMPVFFKLGEVINSFSDAVNDQKMFDRLWSAFSRVGVAIIDIIDMLGIDFSGSAEGFVGMFEGIADWMERNRFIIADWITTVIDKIGELKNWLFGTETQEGAISIFFTWLRDVAYPFIRDTLIPGIIQLKDWLFGKGDEKGAISIVLGKIYDIGVALSPVVGPLVDLLGELGDVIKIAFGGQDTQTFGAFVRDTLVPAIKDFTKWVTENKDMLAELLVWIIKVTFYTGLFSLGLDWLIDKGKKVAGVLLSLVGIFSVIGSIAAFFGLPGLVAVALAAVAGVILGFIVWAIARFALWAYENREKIAMWASEVLVRFVAWKDETLAKISEWATGVSEKFTTWKNDIFTKVDEWATGVKDKITTWKDDVLNTMGTFVVDFLLDVDEASGGGISKFLYYSDETKRILSEWKDRQVEKIIAWEDETLTTVGTWLMEMIAKFTTWKDETLTTVGTWLMEMVARFIAWRDETLAPIISWKNMMVIYFTNIKNEIISIVASWLSDLISKVIDWKNDFIAKVSEFEGLIVDKFYSLGQSIMQGMYDGMVSMGSVVATEASSIAEGIYNTVKNFFGIYSPSKLFEELGGFTMEGMAIGIEKSAGMAVAAMSNAVGKMTMPALQAPAMAYSAASAAPSGNTYSTTNYFSQTVNTSANSEPIIADFNMMESLAGV